MKTERRPKLVSIGHFLTVLSAVMMFLLTAAGTAFAVQPDTVPAETVSYTMSDSQIVMEAEYGYGGVAKGSRYIPVRVAMENKEESVFNGNIQILSMETDNTVYRYQYPVSLEAGSSEKEIYNIPLGTRADQLYVILTDENGSEVMRQRLKLNISLDSAQLLIGILSDTPEELDYMDGVGINYSMLRTKTAVLSADSMPEDKNGLDVLDVILVTNYNLKQLSPEQLEAVMAWVKNGGTLLLGTGQRIADTLGPLSSYLIEEPYSMPEKTAVDMGVEYATNGPGDSFIEAYCSDISLKNGEVVLASDEFPVLTSMAVQKGEIAVAAYDFAEIAPFCREQRSYVEKIFTSLLGEGEISKLADSVYNGQSAQYWSIQNVINTGDVNKLPSLLLYVAVVVFYLILIGPVLYLLLKKKDIRRHYRLAASLVALVFTGIIYVMGNKTRFHDIFFNYASIKDASDDIITETTVLNMRTPYNKPYQVSIDPAYSVRPITRNYYYDMNNVAKFTGAEDARVTITSQAEETGISVKDIVAFDPKYFILEKEEPNTEKVGLTGDITSFDGRIYGKVTNHYNTPVEQAALILYGQMVVLGNLDAGETIELDGLDVINYPLNSSYLVAGRITGSDRYNQANINDKKYMNALEQANLLMYCLDNYFSVSEADARIVGFGTEKEESPFVLRGGYQSYGRTLLTSTVKVNTKVENKVYRPAVPKLPKNSNGGYNADTNTMYGIDPISLEYSLGSGLDIEKVSFDQISEDFTANEKYSYLIAFNGAISFYNYDTGNYDKMDASQVEYTGSQLEPYLSPSNTLTVKYVPELTDEYNWNIMLPMVTVVGRDK